LAAKRILVFESDSAFGKQLAQDFSRYGARVEVVDDGNAGLERARLDRPDLILLCIELPRMNGFSICNKLKKNPELKDIPLVIMSSEATEETFEQHRKLRTRAEDYLRKPFSFDTLLERVGTYVQLDAPGGAEPQDDGVVFDEEIAIEDSIPFDDETMIGSSTSLDSSPPPAPAPEVRVDDEVEAFAEEAFGNLMMGDGDRTVTDAQPTPKKRPKPATPAPVPAPPPIAEEPDPGPTPVPKSAGPGGNGAGGADPAELAEVRAQLERSEGRARDLEDQVQRLSREVQRLGEEVGSAKAEAQTAKAEVQQARSEAQTAKADAAKLTKSGGVSSREFLDLRETINKKDKEILDLRDAINARDKQTFEVRDRVNALEREKADLEDKQIGLEKELADKQEQIEGLVADKDAATKRGDDLKNRLERAQGEIEKAYHDLDSHKAAQERLAAERDEREASAVASRDASVRREMADALAKQKGEHDAAVAVLQSEHTRALEEAEEKKQSSLFDAEERRKTDLRLADDQRREELRQAEARHEAALAAAEAAANALKEKEHNQQIERHGREMAVLGGKLGESEDKLQKKVEELSALRADKEKTDAANAEKVAHLTKRGDDLEGERDSLRVELSTARAEIEVLTTRGRDLADRLADMESKNATNEERALRALTKIRSDEQTLDKAKRAMAIALSLLDEHIQPHPEAAGDSTGGSGGS
jgi:CheY-like chemotaxis protein/chromosome segregation ATPase